MKKRVLVSMMVLAMAATAMVGCGKKDKETEAPVATEATTEAKETEAAATEATTEAAATEATTEAAATEAATEA